MVTEIFPWTGRVCKNEGIPSCSTETKVQHFYWHSTLSPSLLLQATRHAAVKKTLHLQLVNFIVAAVACADSKLTSSKLSPTNTAVKKASKHRLIHKSFPTV